MDMDFSPCQGPEKTQDLFNKRVTICAIVLVVFASQLIQLEALGTEVSPSIPSQNSADGGSTTVSNSSPARNLDLSATQATVSAVKTGSILVGGQLDATGAITGGSAMTVGVGQLLTPAQNVALWQSVAGNQHLLIDNVGAAIGGTAKVNSSWAANLSSLVVPTGVTVATIGFDSNNPLNVAGASNILGSVFALQNMAGMTATMNFGSNLNIAAGGLLSGNLPTPLPGLNLANVYGSQNMLLNVLGNFTNNGTVTIPGNLDLNVAGTFANTSLSGIAGSAATLAAQNINITSGSGIIINSGLMTALDSINIQTMSSITDLTIHNTGGVIQALNAINARDANFAGNSNVVLTGGDFLSRELNLFSGPGLVDVNIGQVSGMVNICAGATHVVAASDVLSVGRIQLSGDPSFYNTAGSVMLNLPLMIQGAGTRADLAVIASTDITATGTGNLDVSSSTMPGGNILLLAGAQFTSSPPSVGQQNNDFSGSILTIAGASSTGGKIDLTGATIGSITSSSTANDGGNITIVALNGSSAPGAGAGTIALGSSTSITSTGKSGISFTNGDVTIIAGATSAVPIAAISIGSITTFTAGGATSGGKITIATATPTITSFQLTDKADGSVTGTATPPIFVGTIQQNSSVSTRALIAGAAASASDQVNVLAGGNVQITGSVSGSQINIASNSANSFTILNTGSAMNGVVGAITAFPGVGGGSITLSNAGGGISLGRSLNNSGTNLSFLANGDIKTIGGSTISIDTSSASVGGSITMVAGAQLTAALNAVHITATGSGGNIDLSSGSGISSLNASNGGAGSNVGNIMLVAFGGGGIGKISIPAAVTVTTSGKGAGTNGNVTMIAGDTIASDVAIGGGFAVTTSGGSGVGGNILIAAATPSIINGSVVSALEPLNVDFGVGQANASVSIGPLNAALSSVAAADVSVLAGGKTQIAGNVAGRNIDIASNSATAFALTSTGPSDNGIVGAISAFASNGSNGGSITLSNAGGGLALSRSIVSPGTSVALIANGSITTGASSSINTSSSTTNGGNIMLVTGVQLSASIDAVRVTGVAAGGNIDLTAGAGITGLNSTSSAANSNGGDITLIAMGGTSVGKISIPSAVTVSSRGAGTGSNGNVTMFAGDTTIGDTALGGGFRVTTSGGTGGNGNILLAAATPEILCVGCSPFGVTISKGNTALPAGIFVGGALQGTAINIGTLTTSNSLNQIYTSGNITFAPGSSVSGCSACTVVGGSAGSTVTNPPPGITIQTDTNVSVPAALAGANVANITIRSISNGNITVDNVLSNAVSSTFIASGSGTITTTGGIVISSPIITLASGSGDINVQLVGSSSVTSNTVASSTLHAIAGNISLGAANVGGTYSVDVGGNITTTGAIRAGQINFQSTSGTGSIAIGADLTGTTSITLATAGSGTITTPARVIEGVILPRGGPKEGGTVNQAGTFAYAAGSSNFAHGILVVINTSSNAVVDTIPVEGIPQAVAVNPAGTLVYVVSGDKDLVSVIDTATHSVVAKIAVGNSPQTIAMNATGTRAYVSNYFSDNVSVIDTATNTVVATIPVGTSPYGVAINPAGTLAYVANSGNNRISVINTTTNSVVATIVVPVGSSPAELAVNPNGMYVYVTNSGSNSVSVIDTASNTVIGTVPIGAHTKNIAVDPTGTLAYVVNTSGSIKIINTSTNAIISTLPSLGTPYPNQGNFLNFVGNNLTSYSTNALDNTVAVIQTPAIIAPIVALASGSGDLSVTLAGSVGLTATTNGNVNITSAGALTLGASHAGGHFTAGSLSSITTDGSISASSITLQTTGGTGGITLNASLVGTTSTTLSSTGNIVSDLSTAITSPSASLTAIGGNIGGNAAATNLMSLDVGALTLNAGNNVSIADTSTAVTIAAPSAAGNTFNLQTGNLTSNLTSSAKGTITANAIVLNSNQGFSFLTDIQGSSSISISAGSNINNGDFATKASFTTSSLILSAGGSIGNTGALNTAAGTLSATATGNIAIVNNGTLNLTTSAAGGDLAITASLLDIAGPVAGTSISLTSGGGISLLTSAATVTADTSATLKGTSIIGTGKITADSIVLNATAGDIGPIFTDSHSLTATATGAITITNTGSFLGLSATAGGALIVYSDTITIANGKTIQGSTVSLNGLTTNGSFGDGTNMVLSNSGVIRSTADCISLSTASGQDLTITGDGNGSFVTPGSKSINISATDNASNRHPGIILGPGDQTFLLGSIDGGQVNITADGGIESAVTIQPGVTYDFPDNATHVTLSVGKFFGDPSQFNVHSALHPNPNSTLTIKFPFPVGTIANSTGPIDLSQLSNLTFAGQNLAILSATDIINGSGTPLTIKLSGGASAGNLVLIAGFDFSPSTNGLTVGPDGTPYTLAGVTAGGSIKLGTVNINTAASAVGGDVLAVASKGSVSSGSITLGTVTTAGAEKGGSVTIIGNGIGIAELNTTAGTLSASGAVSLLSTASVELSNPGGTQVIQGVLTGGTFLPGVASGSVAVGNEINAGKGLVTLQGTSISAGGLVSADYLTLTANGGNINLNTATSVFKVTQSGAGSVILTDSVALTSTDVSTAGSGGFFFTSTAGGAKAINITAKITTSGPLSLISSDADGGMVILGSLTGSSVSLNANGAGTIQQTGGLISGSSLTLSAGSGAISIIDTNATTISSTSNGNIDITNSATGGLVSLLGSSSSTGTLNVNLIGVAESLQINAPVSGASISLTAKDGGISQLNSGSTITGVDSVVLTAGNGSVVLLGSTKATALGTGIVSITSSALIIDSGLAFIAADNINLKSTGGNVNLAAGLTPVTSLTLDGKTGVSSTGVLNTNSLTVRGGTGAISVIDTKASSITATATGNVDITDSATSGLVSLLGSSSSTGTLNVNLIGVAESLQINAPVSGASISLTAKDGGISQLNSGCTITGVNSVALTAGNGSVILIGNTKSTAPATGLVSIIASASITDSGLAFITADNISLKSTGSNVNLIAGLTATASITLDGKTGISSTGLINTNALTLKGGTGAISVIDTKATSILATSTGNIDVTDSASGGLVSLLGSSSTNGSLTLSLSGTGESLRVSGPISGKSIALTAKDGGISQLNSSATITALNDVALTAGNGVVALIGTTKATSKITGLVSLTASGLITDSGLGFISADNIKLRSTGLRIDLSAALVATVSLNLDGSIGVYSNGKSLSTTTLTINGGIGSVDVSTNATSLTATANGSVTISDTALSGPVSLNSSSSTTGSFQVTSSTSLNVNGALSGASVILTSSSGSITQVSGATITAADSVRLTASGGTVTLAATTTATKPSTGLVSMVSSGWISGDGIANIAADNISLTSTNLGVSLTTPVSAPVSLILDGQTEIHSTMLLNTPSLIVRSGGAIEISSTNASNAVFSTTNSVNITNIGSVIFGASNGGAVTLTSAGSLTVAGTVSAVGSLTVKAPTFNVNGDIQVSIASAGSGSGSTSASGIPSGVFSSNPIAPGSLNVYATTINVGAAKTVSAAEIVLNAPSNSALNIANSGTLISIGSITANSWVGFDLNVSGGGLMSAGNTISLTAALSTPGLGGGSITIPLSGTQPTGPTTRVHFSGTQTFTGTTVLNASGINQSVDVDKVAVVTGNNTLILNTNVLNNQGIITGNPLIFEAQGVGTIANSSGSVDLKDYSSLQFNGRTLAILAAGSIINTGAAKTIDLSGSANSPIGGTLRLIAGYSFAPAASFATTTSPVATPFVISGTSSAGVGNISLSNVSINTSATGANHKAGDVFAVATGSVALGNIITTADSSSGTGGSVSIIANGIITGAISTAAKTGGNVMFSAAIPTIAGTITVQNGLISGGNFTPAALVGNITVDGINTGNGNITLATGASGAITQGYSGTLTTTGLLAVTAGSRDFTLNIAVGNVAVTTSSASAAINSSVATTLNTSSVGGNLSLTGTKGIAIGGGQTITTGGNLSLNNSGMDANVTFGDGVVLTAGSLTASGTGKLGVIPQFGLVTSDVQKAGAISIQSSGATGAASNGIIFGTGVQVTSNGGDIVFNSTKTNANINTGDFFTANANGGSINLNNSGGNANLGIAGGTRTTLNAVSLNGYNGGALNITASGVRIGGGAAVNIASLSLSVLNGFVDIAPGTGGNFNIGGSTSILSSGGVTFGSGTTFQSGTSMSILAIGSTSGIFLGNNVSVTAGALNAGAPTAQNAILTNANIKSSGSMMLTVIGSGGIVGGTNVSLGVIGGGMSVIVVGQNGSFNLGDQANIHVDGGSINLFSLGSVTLGAIGGTGGSIVVRQVGTNAGAVSIAASNGMVLGDNTRNYFAGGLSLSNYGTGGSNPFIIGSGSSSTVLGSASFSQFGPNSSMMINANSTIKSAGPISIMASGIAAGKTIEIGGNVYMEASAGSISLSSLGAGTFNVGDGSSVKAGNGSITIFSSGAVNLGSVTGINTMSAAGSSSQISVLANALSVNGASTLSTSGSISVLALSSTGALTFGAGSSLTAGGTISILSLGTGITTGVGAKLAAANGITLNQFGSGGFAFGDGTQFTVSNGPFTLFTLKDASFGAGSKVTATGNSASLSLMTFTGVKTGIGSTFATTSGSLSLTNLGAGKLQVSDGTSLSGYTGLTMSANGGDIEIGNNVQLTAGALNSSPVPPISPLALTSANIKQAGGISMTGNNITVGTGAVFTSHGADIQLSSQGQTAKISVGDLYNFTANGGSISVNSSGSGANALTIGVVGGSVAGSKMTARALGSSGSLAFSAQQGDVLLGAGTMLAGTSMSASSGSGITTVSGTVISASTNVNIAGGTALAVENGSSVSALNNLTLSASGYSGAPMLTIGKTGGSAVTLKAGSLAAGAPVSGVLLPSNIATSGSLVLSAPLVNIKDNSILISNGNDLKVTATNGPVTIGAGNTFQANGGSVQVLAQGALRGGIGNIFYARAVGSAGSASQSTGGGIEIGSGLTNGNVNGAFSIAPGTNPAAGSLGAGVGFSGNAGGVIQANLSGGGKVNLNAGPNPASTLTLTKGVLLFDAQGSSSSVVIDNGTFKTEALRPIAMVTPVRSDRKSLVAPSVTIKHAGSDTHVEIGKHVAELHVFNINDDRSVIVSAEESSSQVGKHSVQIYARPKTQFTHTAKRELHLISGELFLNSSDHSLVKTDLVDVHAMRGALASVRAENGRTYVRVCSASGTVSAMVEGKPITLNSGEELVVTDHKPDDSEIYPADGLGRRNSHTTVTGSKYVTVNDFSIITMVSNHETLLALRNARGSSERRLIDRLLKNAATVDVVLKYRGPYRAKI